MSKRLKEETNLRGVNTVDPRTIDMSKELRFVVIQLHIQIDERSKWIQTQTTNVLKHPFRYGKKFRRDIQNSIHVYNDDIEYIKTQLLLLGKPYGQN